MLTVLAITIIVVLFFAVKKIFIAQLQINYERSLLKGNKKKANQLGKMYYLSLDEKVRKSKGIINIEEKISDDFDAFNKHYFSIF